MQQLPQVGDVLNNRYELLSELGQGGFSRVYKAHQLTTRQNVAIKLISPPTVSDGDRKILRKRFRRETRLCAALNHPNIVRLLDAGETEAGLLYSVFEYLPGEDLMKVLEREGALPLQEVGHLMVEVLDALGAAHSSGVIHRDLKPGNIMISKGGPRRNATILDFGVGIMLTETSGEWLPRLSLSGELLGTPLYAAPEQLRGQDATPRSDLYSWGLVFLECMLGQPVIHGHNITDIIFNQLSGDPVDIPRSLRVHPLGELLRWVSHKDPDRRPSSVAQVMAPLGEIDFRHLEQDLEDLSDFAPTGSEDTLDLGPPLLADDPQELTLSDQEEEDHCGVEEEEEYRQVTVLCCQAILLHHDQPPPSLDQYDEALRRHLRRCRAAAARYGATVEVRSPEEVLLIFGLPLMHEGDHLRAARAVTALLKPDPTREVPRGEDALPTAQLRLGLHTGQVIVRRDSSGPDQEATKGLVGMPPFVARRLAEWAPAGGALASAATAHLLRGQCSLSELGDCRLGPDQPSVQAFMLGPRLDDPAGLATRFSGTLSPLTGRQGLMGILQDRWEHTTQGDGQALLLLGEPKRGRSRLCWEFSKPLAESGYHYLELICEAHHRHEALHPLAGMLRRLLCLARTDPPDLCRARLQDLLDRIGMEPDPVLPLLLPLVEPPMTTPPAAEVPSEMLQDTLLGLIYRMCEEGPVALIAEDLHHADSATLDLLEALVAESAAIPLLSLFSARTQFSPSWPSVDVLPLAVPALTEEAAWELLEQLSGDLDLTETQLQNLAHLAGGVPFFLEELINQVRQGEGLPGDLPRPGVLAPAGIPAALRDTIGSSLDALGPARITAALAATLGQVFPDALLMEISPLDAATLKLHLGTLVQAKILRRSKVGGLRGHAFTHPLTRKCSAAHLSTARRNQVQARANMATRERNLELPD